MLPDPVRLFNDAEISANRSDFSDLRPLDATRGIATATDKTRKLPNSSVW